MGDEPLKTRWTFEDFKMFYNVRFGRKKEINKEDPKLDCNGRFSDANVNTNANIKSTSDMAVYEQFEQQGRQSGIRARSDGAMLKPLLPSFDSAETRSLAEALCRDIIRENPDVKWETIKGLQNAKRLVKEAVVMPIKYPNNKNGVLGTSRGFFLLGREFYYLGLLELGRLCLQKLSQLSARQHFLIFQLPQLLANGEVENSGKVIDSVKLHKRLYLLGDSEKLVRVLFELARHHAPSTIFLDEIDAIISQRGEARSEHEASRRLKTELLIQMDGLTKTDELVFVLAATNLPWELDSAMLRRLEKRILVPLPEPEARLAIFEELLSSSPGETKIPYDYLVEKTEGFSGSDIRLVCKEAAMQPLRRLMSFLESQPDKVPEDDLPAVGPVTPEDIEVALRNTRPSAHLHVHRYEKFNQDYGSQILS